jgi:hypothetical protein
MFNVAWLDLNGDGVKDLLVTSQGASGSGKVLAYEQPAPGTSEWADGAAWTKHTLADGYKPLKAYLPGRGSPGETAARSVPWALLTCVATGTATPFAAPPGSSGGAKPWIAVQARSATGPAARRWV